MGKRSVPLAVPAKKVVVNSPYRSKAIFGAQGQRLIPLITQEMCGTTGLSACMVFMPPGRIAKAHLHAKTDIIVVVIEGYAATLIGPEMEPVFHGPGEFIFIPEGVLHVAVNLSSSERLIAIEMRTDPKLNEDVIVTPEYDEKAMQVVAALQEKYAAGLGLPEHWNTKDTGPFTFADVTESSLLPA
ncbi:MAG TPA: cupin domain-containing protein [Candidatus Saccharimonadales bacterium]|nr:cupin domain-containing protein [Candidatus Saccharimonadales bacterium]